MGVGRASAPELSAHVESALTRKHDVEDHQVVGRLRGLLEGLPAVSNGVDHVALAHQPIRQREHQARLVLDEEYSLFAHAMLRLSSRALPEAR